MVAFQLGNAVATKLFERVGIGGTMLLRFGLGALIMLALVRPRLRGRSAPTCD